MKPEELSRSITKGEISPLYYFYGEEPYLLDREVSRLLSLLVAPEYRDFNLNVFYGNECRGEDVADAAQTLPFFADRRLVLVRNASALSAGAFELLVPYVQNPSPATCLLFVGDKIDLRRKFFVEMKKHGELVEFRRLYENQLNSFVRSEARLLGKDIEGAAADYLVYLVGNNLQELVSQIGKLVDFSGNAASITVAAVKEMASDTRADSVFDLANAAADRDCPRALRSLHTLLRDGQQPVQILFMLARHFRQVWVAGDLSAKKVSQQEMGRVLGMKSSFFLPGLVKQGRNFSSERMREIFSRLWEADQALKSVRVKPSVILERLVLDICS
jgi:DNA polymerase III subunit delta